MEQPRRFAILVGVNCYEHRGIQDLEFAAPDAGRVRDALQAAGYQEGDVLLLADGVPDPRYLPTRQALLEHAPAWLAEKQPGPEDTVLFLFGGHGVEDAQRVDYVLPRDADLDNLADARVLAGVLAAGHEADRLAALADGDSLVLTKLVEARAKGRECSCALGGC